jgi:hypothetical protein
MPHATAKMAEKIDHRHVKTYLAWNVYLRENKKMMFNL